jgi:hypothetical protein
MQRYVLKNNSGTVLNLAKNKIMFRPNQMIDIVSRTGKTIIDIENDPEIMREIGYKNLVLIERFDPNDKSEELSRKMDSILAKLEPINVEPVASKEIKENNEFNINDIKDVIKECLKSVLKSESLTNIKNIESEDDKIREMAMEKLLKTSSPMFKNLNLGVDKEVEHEDHSGDIDF